MTRRSGRVFWVNQFAVPPDQPGGTRHYDMAGELDRLGHDVRLLASDLSLHERRYSRRRSAWDLRVLSETIGDVRFEWLPAGSYERNDWRRVASMMVFALAALGRLLVTRRHPGDVVIGSSPHLLGAAGAWAGARITRRRFILEVRDLWPESYTAVAGPGGVQERLLRTLADWLYRQSDHIVILAEGSRANVVDHGASVRPDLVHPERGRPRLVPHGGPRGRPEDPLRLRRRPRSGQRPRGRRGRRRRGPAAGLLRHRGRPRRRWTGQGGAAGAGPAHCGPGDLPRPRTQDRDPWSLRLHGCRSDAAGRYRAVLLWGEPQQAVRLPGGQPAGGHQRPRLRHRGRRGGRRGIRRSLPTMLAPWPTVSSPWRWPSARMPVATVLAASTSLPTSTGERWRPVSTRSSTRPPEGGPLQQATPCNSSSSR